MKSSDHLRGLGGSGGDDDGVLHGVVLLKGLDELSDGGALLTDGNVDTVELLGLVLAVVPPLLVEDGVKSDGSLTGLTVTNDQLTLTTADGNHGVDGLETSLHGLVDGLAGKDTGSLLLGAALLGGLDGALAINGVSESVNDTAEKSLADGDVDNLAGTLDGLALLDESVGTEKHNTDLAGLEVHAHALDTGGEPVCNVSRPVGWMLGAGKADATYSTSSSAWTLFMPWTRAIPSLKGVLVHWCSWRVSWLLCFHTRRRGHGRSRRDRTPPGHHGSSARGWR